MLPLRVRQGALHHPLCAVVVIWNVVGLHARVGPVVCVPASPCTAFPLHRLSPASPFTASRCLTMHRLCHGLRRVPLQYHYLNQSGVTTVENINDEKDYEELVNAMDVLNMRCVMAWPHQILYPPSLTSVGPSQGSAILPCAGCLCWRTLT